MKHTIVEIFRSSKNADMYLYVLKADGFKKIPDELKTMFGKGVSVMTMLLKPDQKLAHADPEKVMQELTSKGFYLQLPPPKEPYLLDIYRTPTESRY